jgi:hypothetical protein
LTSFQKNSSKWWFEPIFEARRPIYEAEKSSTRLELPKLARTGAIFDEALERKPDEKSVTYMVPILFEGKKILLRIGTRGAYLFVNELVDQYPKDIVYKDVKGVKNPSQVRSALLRADNLARFIIEWKGDNDPFRPLEEVRPPLTQKEEGTVSSEEDEEQEEEDESSNNQGRERERARQRERAAAEKKKKTTNHLLINLPLLFKEQWQGEDNERNLVDLRDSSRTITKDIKDDVHEQQGYRCRITGFPLFQGKDVRSRGLFMSRLFIMEYDHRKPWIRGGLTNSDNIQLLSAYANGMKKAFCTHCDEECEECGLAFPETHWKILGSSGGDSLSCISPIYMVGRRIRRRIIKNQCFSTASEQTKRREFEKRESMRKKRAA